MNAPTVDTFLSVSRSIELSVLVKATLILGLGIGAAQFARHARASVRHLLLAVMFGALMALPLMVVAAPQLTIEVPVTEASGPIDRTTPSGASTGAPGAPRSDPETVPISGISAVRPSWAAVGRWIWIAGSAGLCISLLAAIIRVRHFRRHSLPRPELSELVQRLAQDAGIRRTIEVLEHEDLLAPLTCGLTRPAVLLPLTARQWTVEDVRRALVHELEHVRRGDWLVHLAARVVCAAYWFHPLAWVALRRMCLDAERACDDAVVRQFDRTDYADQLVLLARQLSARHTPAILGMANRSDLSARVTALLDDRQLRGRVGIAAAVTAVAAAVLVVTPIASVRAVERVTLAAGGASDRSSDSTSTSEEQTRRTSGQRARGIDRALYEAAADGDMTEIDQLLRAGANVNAAISGDGSPLIGAARRGHLEAVRLLLDRGADANMPVSGDGNPLIMAASEGHAAIVELLLDRGARVDQIVPGDESALIQASNEGHLDVVKLLIARGADVNLGVWVDSRGLGADREWRSPLSMARRNRHGSTVAFLVSAGARE